MDRTVKTKIELTDNLTATQKAKLVDLMKSGDIELVNRQEKLVSWSQTETGEDEFLTLAKAGKAEIVDRFPDRWFDDGKKAVKLTKENLKDIDLKNVSKEYPKKYEVKEDDRL